QCGRDPDYCSTPGNCISNCDAKAECGKGAEVPGTGCPLNVCCGPFGYCGTTERFCTTTGDKVCQSNCAQPASTGRSGADVRKLVIGYLGAWQITRRGCAQRDIEHIPIDSLTHLNVAFGYIKPSTFEVHMMQTVGTETLRQVTNLKQKAPGLKIWIVLGGWTFSDNGTTTQPVWGDLASTATKRGMFIQQLRKFMEQWGFDGVDLDWEYPGAGDRGGKKEDGDNFVYLLEEYVSIGVTLGFPLTISVTAPTSYWYLRWFPIDRMYQHVDWINLMSYDLHGSWDSPESWIGSYIYAHTNLTEIDEALKLLWRNEVPANKVNLGIGFYGRSYTLENNNCNTPGCPFSRAGTAGTCTGEPGILSFAEIESMKKIYGYKPIFDEETAVKYFSFGEDQWVSYDDADTLKLKVDFAQKQGLLGLFVWAVDLDTLEHDALKALLGGELGIFTEQNGIRPGSLFDDWVPAASTRCEWSECGSKSCPVEMRGATAEEWCGKEGGVDKTRLLCCPTRSVPDPATCDWELRKISGFHMRVIGLTLESQPGTCPVGRIPVMTSTDPWYKSGHISCLLGGTAPYCCDEVNNGEGGVICYEDKEKCIEINSAGQPSRPGACSTGYTFSTYTKGSCRYGKNSWHPVCCDNDAVTNECYWTKGNTALWCEGAQHCSGSNEVIIATDKYGGGNKGCRYTLGSNGGPTWEWKDADLNWCCPASGLQRSTVNLPVPLKDLFPTPGPISDKQKLGIEMQKNKGNNVDPNKDAFGFFILSGPPNELTTMNKRDGSHWELFNCPDEKHEGTHTVQAVCTDTSSQSNCHDIFQDGVAYTVVEMPDGCGPGSYAMAVSLERSKNFTRLPHHLEKRSGVDPRIYDFTFDYDFTAVNKRASTNVLMRIDYSDDAGYWASVVAAPRPETRKRDEEEVHRDHGGDYKSWMEHTWHKEKRMVERDELHARWFSGKVSEWFQKQKDISINHNIFRHDIHDEIDWTLIDQEIDCLDPLKMHFEAHAILTLDVKASAGVTMIGTLGNLQSFFQSHVWFRSKGNIDVELKFSALARMSFHTGEVELFGAQNFGSPFRVPGLVTIGPNFRIVAQISGDAVIEFETSYKLDVIGWDYSQRYPPVGVTADTDSVDEEGAPKEPGFTGPKSNPIKWNLDASGEIITRIVPKVTLGVVFDSDKVANAEIVLGVEAWARLWGTLEYGSTRQLNICYGANGQIELFAQIVAP
ncbi:glycosyl hydrolases family 18-domain-containing protein, partial [Leptodontidium sp. 2 PMI_412]